MKQTISGLTVLLTILFNVFQEYKLKKTSFDLNSKTFMNIKIYQNLDILKKKTIRKIYLKEKMEQRNFDVLFLHK